MDATSDALVSIGNVLARIPEGIWGVVVGSILAFLGAWFSSRWSRAQQRQQLEFEKAERERERRHQLRRDVYLAAAESVVSTIWRIGQMGSLRAEADALEKASERLAITVARVQMIASEKTIRAFGALHRAVLNEIAVMHYAVYPMMLRKVDIDIALKSRDNYQNQRAKIIEQMTEDNLQGLGDQLRRDRLGMQEEFLAAESDKHGKEWNSLIVEQLRAEHEVARGFATRFEPLMAAQTEALVAIREELEFDAAATALLDELRATVVASKVGIEGAIELVQETVRKIETEE